MCEHLIELDNEIKAKGISETFRGKAWKNNCREWVYYNCQLDLGSLRNKYAFQDFIINHRNDDNKSGMEVGFICDICHDAIIGLHPHFGRGEIVK